ncbi:T9SS type A sorting domain-containing protein [Neolewinella aurantiaca]|uniref:T9SS type A sorting domain-containing protein n=1 Tax=Neolewinella aurantiaca TaxID=2602767 RepID=A0A5C7FRG4_9BACT|nr:T9SS type A sorting domain-containing protein [Neolewinella aurantiaca]TXF88044.1 T9SS type A sorting domain-containing protein [Neolewinella aurantiaca]
MIRFLLLLALVVPTAFNLSAQCEDLTTNCPEDLSFNLKAGESDTTFVVSPPDTNQCGTANLYYTINGPVGAAGRGVPGEFGFETGTSELTYQYSESRSGEFTQDAALLPDGNGSEYEVSFEVIGTGGSDQTVGEAGGLARICAVMEHSYLGDLDIWITCSDGTAVNIHTYDPASDVGRQLLGQGDESTVTPDPPGLYCWSVGAPNTMSEHVTIFNVGSNQTMPDIDYKPEQPLSRFDSSLIAGEWNLHFRDNLARDNGSVASVFVDFGTNLAPPCVQEVKINQGTVSNTEPGLVIPELRAYPNPVTDQLTIQANSTSGSQATLEIYSPNGQLLETRSAYLSAGENTFQLSAKDWPVGVYSVRVTDGSSERWTKVVKTQ